MMKEEIAVIASVIMYRRQCCLLLRILKVYRNERCSGYIQYTSRGLNIHSTRYGDGSGLRI